MRVGLVIYGDLSTLSGGFLYDRKLVEHLRKRGDWVRVFSLPWRTYPGRLLDNFSDQLIADIEAAALDVLLQDELNHASLFQLNRRLRRRSQLPLVAIVHHLRSSEPGPGWQRSVIRRIERAYLASVDGYIFNSRTTRRVVEAMQSGSKPALVAYPGGDRLGGPASNGEVERRVFSPGPLRLLFVGNLIPRKGLHVLLRALGQMAADWDLQVVGSLESDPRYSAGVLRDIQSSDLSGRVRMLGPVDGQKLSQLMASSHLLVVPSYYEGFGIVYIEGMAFGLPAIGTRAGAAGEIIEHGHNGYLIPAGDAAALRGYLMALQADRDRLYAMSLAGLRRAERHPTWEQTDARIRDFLRETYPSRTN